MRASTTSRSVLAGFTATVLTAGLGLAVPAAAAPSPTPSATASPSSSSSAQAATATKTKVTAGTSTAGAKTTLTATVSPKPNGGTVTLSVSGKALSGCSKVTVSSGKASCSTVFASAGTRTVSAAYSGTSTYKASTGTATVKTVAAPAATTFVGSLGSCTTSTGALVAVDFKTWKGPAVRGCDTTPTTGIDLLKTAGFTTAGDQHDGPQFICRIGHPLFSSGTQYPTPAQDPCVVTPPASAYWSYWLAPKGSNTWSYAQFGAYSQKTVNGDVQAWTFGGTDIAGTNGQPSFTPNQVRAGLPSAGATVQRHALARAQAAPQATPLASAGSTPNLSKGADYLINGKSSFTGEANLVDGHYYDEFGTGFADFGLTIDAVYALAATGTNDAAVRKIMDFLDNGGTDRSSPPRTINDWTGIGTENAQGGSIGKVALAAEMTGYNPRKFAGHDLIKALDGIVCSKLVDYVCYGVGNYRFAASTFSQVLGIMAQLRAGDLNGAKVPIGYLESLQRKDGAFPSTFPAEKSSDETDSTGMAAMGLAMVPGPKARGQVAKALAWLASKQEPDGGFPGAAGDSTNSAAITIQALRLDAQKYSKQIAKAEKFLAAEQNPDGGFNIASTGQQGSDVRASAQSVGGAVGTPFGSVLDDLGAKATASSGAAYLVKTLTDGSHYVFDGTTTPDAGQTADGLFALLGAGGQAGTVAKMTTWLTGQVDAYADPSGKQGGPYSGSLAKLALIAEATGQDPHSFGGVDLLTLLRNNVCTKAIAGDNSPCIAKGDFRNGFSTVSQALGVLALQASPKASDHLTATSPVVVRLHQLQCKDGGFPSLLLKYGDKCTSEVDTTGYAVQALTAVQGTDTWLGSAQQYLQKVQRSDGLYVGASGVSSNSTALAAGALQSLVAALTSPTADPPQPKTVAPIAAWQSALTGLTSLAVSGGGYRISSATKGADLRSSTQGVLAGAQQTLLGLSGAQVLSLPRAPSSDPPGIPRITGDNDGSVEVTATGSGNGSAGGHRSDADAAQPLATDAASAGGTADTGVPTETYLVWAALLLVLGAACSLAGRRRALARRPHEADS